MTTALEATSAAVARAASLGVPDVIVSRLFRGANWWVAVFSDDAPLGLSFVVVEDGGAAHVEATPFGPWFEGIREVPLP